MKIIVCIKQVPNTAQVRINPETNTLVREGVESIINPYDVYALEEGVRIKERSGGTVTVLTMGPPQAETALREAIALGADDAVLLSDRAFAGSDTWATSYTLSLGIRKIGSCDLVICGKQAVDGDTAQVGPGISDFLDLPFVAFVRKIEEMKSGYMRVERLMEDGYEIIESPMPAVISVVNETTKHRSPPPKGQMRAKKVVITKWGAQDLAADADKLGLKGSPTKVVKIFTPPHHKQGRMFTGKVDEMVNELVSSLRAEKVV